MKRPALILLALYFLVVNTGYYVCLCRNDYPERCTNATEKGCCSNSHAPDAKCHGIVLKATSAANIDQGAEYDGKPSPKQWNGMLAFFQKPVGKYLAKHFPLLPFSDPPPPYLSIRLHLFLHVILR